MFRRSRSNTSTSPRELSVLGSVEEIQKDVSMFEILKKEIQDKRLRNILLTGTLDRNAISSCRIS